MQPVWAGGVIFDQEGQGPYGQLQVDGLRSNYTKQQEPLMCSIVLASQALLMQEADRSEAACMRFVM